MMDYFLADDLSGALDAAAAFHVVGRRVRVVLGPADWRASPCDDVIAITTETRTAAPAVAAEIVAQALAHAGGQGGRLVYKKIDSTLRGAVAAELAALRRALSEREILFCPANPAVGRTVEGGVLLVRGVPVAETEFGRDPVTPVRHSDVRMLLGAAAAARVMIADARTADDLARAVERIAAAAGSWVAVGSGALARPVAAWLAREAGKPAPVRAESGEAPPTGAPLFICGSAHPANHAQARRLALDRGVMLAEISPQTPGAAVSDATRALQEGRGVALVAPRARADSREVLQAIAHAGAEVQAAAGAQRVFVTGGETAFAWCTALGIGELEFRAEVEPGLSVSRAAAAGCTLLVAVKPGGFGDEHTWVRAWDALMQSR